MVRAEAPRVAHDNIPAEYGPRLARWIEGRVPEGQSWRALALARGIEPSRLVAWRRGAVPGIEQLQLVAKALGASMSDVLIEIGAMPRGDGPTTPVEVPVPVPVYDVDKAIDKDPSLRPEDRSLLRAVRRSLAMARQSA